MKLQKIMLMALVIMVTAVSCDSKPMDEYVAPEPVAYSYADIEKRQYIIIPSVFVEEQENVNTKQEDTGIEFESKTMAIALTTERKLPYPEYITVRITGLKECEVGMRYKVIEIPFKDYVKGVLANEWGHDWHEESLRTGAIAIKMYAWHAVRTGGKWDSYDNGVVYDCNWDMVYNPDITRASTNKAVDDTWNVFITEQDGTYMKTHFLAWWGACINWLGDDANCIGQWNSKQDAEYGMTYEEILHKYLNKPIIITYNYGEEK